MIFLYFLFGFLTLLFLLLGYLAAKEAYRTWRSATLLSRTGVLVKGHITGRHEQSSSTGAAYGRGSYTFTIYSVEFGYVYGGKEYSGQAIVNKSAYDNWPEGWEVDVVCAPTDPDQAQLASASTPSPWGRLIVVVLLGIISFAISIVSLIVLLILINLNAHQ
jgi:hypothetical protein